MKRSYIIAIALFLTLTIGVVYMTMHSVVTFTGPSTISSVDLYRNNKKITSTSINNPIVIEKGSYQIKTQGENVAEENPDISANSLHQSITLDPDYSESKLTLLKADNDQIITKAFTAKYPALADEYTIETITYLSKGEWAGTLIVPTSIDRQNPTGYYRALFKKDRERWRLVGRPEPLLTVYTTPDVPLRILTKVNRLSL